jgi:hypothetical protein
MSNAVRATLQISDLGGGDGSSDSGSDVEVERAQLEALRDLSQSKTDEGAANMKQLEFQTAISTALSSTAVSIKPNQVKVLSSKVGDVALPVNGVAAVQGAIISYEVDVMSDQQALDTKGKLLR